METKVLMGISSSIISKETLKQFMTLPFEKHSMHITLIHVFRRATSSEQLLGMDYQQEQIDRYQNILQQNKSKLIENGFDDQQICIKLIEDPYPTVADGLIDQFKKGDYQIVALGRKRMSKAEEFVMGDPCTRLIRELENTIIMIYKSR